MRRFRVTDLAAVGARQALPEDAAHHLVRVLRQGAGARVHLFDGHGLAREAVVVEIGAEVIVEVTGVVATIRAPECHLVLAVLKGPAMSDAIRMATEAGMTHLWPFTADRSVARPDRIDRWERITAAAAEQCGRADLPLIAEPVRLDAVLSRLPPVELFAAAPGSARYPDATGPRAVVVGPEGGLTSDELTTLDRHGAARISLGPHVLRADTAAAVAVALTHPRRGEP
jgi:16S rRNA (uracil1498-N3)-methyltransferase